ncbi:MAG: tyrosine-type recombinase/integrase [Proteobacteria bacterium]|nr:tyrosine-type recombinase/integrase [Pseudomonadota bacterium]
MLDIDGFLGDLQNMELTARTYATGLRQYARFLDLDGGEPNLDTARAFIRHLREKGRKDTTIFLYGQAVRSYFAWRDPEKPFRLKLPTPNTELKPFLHESRIMEVYSKCRTPLQKAVIMLLYNCALRSEELRTLQDGDVIDEQGFLWVLAKGGSRQRVQLGPQTLQVLRRYIEWRKPGRHLFPYTYNEIKAITVSRGRSAGIKNLTPHLLRHSKAANMLLQGVPLEQIRDHLRHKKFETTLRYAQISEFGMRPRVPEASLGESW